MKIPDLKQNKVSIKMNRKKIKMGVKLKNGFKRDKIFIFVRCDVNGRGKPAPLLSLVQDDDDGDDDDIYIMMKCVCVTNNHHFLHARFSVPK